MYCMHSQILGLEGVWEQLGVSPDSPQPVPRVGHTSVLYIVEDQYVMLVYGGDDPNKVTLDDSWLLTINMQDTCFQINLFNQLIIF
jgi:hypothetical protein